jgi:patatin-like phospholipase/acyl hydrolase
MTLPHGTPAASAASNIRNILSWDGGPSPLLWIRILKHVEQQVFALTGKSFISRTDLFAGTSNGAYMSLFLASRLCNREQNGVQVIDDCIQDSNNLLRAFHASPMGMLRLLFGLRPLNDGTRVKKVLTDHLGTQTLETLNKKVMAITYDVQNNQMILMHNATPRAIPSCRRLTWPWRAALSPC